VQGSVFIVTFE